MMTPVPDDAECSYGWEGCTHMPARPDGAAPALPAIPWIEREQRITLRWWQRLSLLRQLEHRADGSLCFREKVESAPRRAGKSVGLRGGMLWRIEHGYELFGEEQTAIHTGSDMAICREIQRGAWRWAESRGWEVTRGNGKEAIEGPAGRWLVRAQDAVYGYDLMYGIVDEAWDVKPDTVSEGLEPATLERSSPQIVKTSTAHRRARSTMRVALTDAMTGDDPETLLLLWGALAGSDPGDERVWRAASPNWSADRRKLIAAKYRKALAGENDREFDDPDPMRGFESQYLNIWHLAEVATVGNPIVTPEVWAELAGAVPVGVPDSVAVEAWFAAGVAVAYAWTGADGGPVVVQVVDYPDLPAAAAAVKARGCARRVLVGASLIEDDAWRASNLRTTKMTASTRGQVADLVRFIGEGKFRHADAGPLTDQVLVMRTSPSADGLRIRTTERADAIKAAVWAITGAAGSTGSGLDTVIVVDW
jgi:hypothetical protein